MSGTPRRVLVAGIGNVFLGDDGFGVEVVRRVDGSALPASVDVADYGIRGVHLAYDLLDGRHDTLVMVDAVPVDGPPGTLAILDVSDAAGEPAGDTAGDAAAHAGVPAAPAVDGHGMDPLTVLRLLRRLGGAVERALVVGCRPASLEERMGLSEPVAAAVPEAVRLVMAVAREESAPAAAQGAEAARTVTARGVGADA
ncbi:peptidase M52 [Actinomadura rubrobrunea]|uniref:Peptidase M52 n=1 Tax=Actinomadura rubrobrunea TaxID=115335 RepID=A0A9W6PY81_9ACTN|nr:hydrogenase maturation protease [Actinomadura rubrobrunea]GLW64902.1 peptidase M52 [Actinomadura rubrobrunea]